MIDVHTHILPNVDDGSKSLDLSIEMLKDEVKQGVDTVFLTPHYRGDYVISPKELKTEFEKFKQTVQTENIPVNLFLGEEVFVKKNIKQSIENGEVVPMADKNFILLEFDYVDRCEVSIIAHEIKCMGYKPIIAHAERYTYLTLDDIYSIKRAGGMIQVNADSLVGVTKHLFKGKVKKMFKQGLVDFVASDVHYNRRNCMADAYGYVKRKFGDDVAEATFNLNAERLLKG